MNKIKFEEIWGELEAKIVFRDNDSQNLLDKLWFSCQIVKYMKVLISIFQQFFASVNKIFFLGGGVGGGGEKDWVRGYNSPFLNS